MSSEEEEDERDRRSRFRRERCDEEDELMHTDRKRNRNHLSDEEENRDDKKRRRTSEDEERITSSQKYREISFFERHWKAEWFQRMFNPLQRNQVQKQKEENAKASSIEFQNDKFVEKSYDLIAFQEQRKHEPQHFILILSDVPEEMSSETCKQWIYDTLKKKTDEDNLLSDIVFSNPLKRPGFNRFAFLICKSESTLESVQNILNGQSLSFRTFGKDSRESFRRVLVERFSLNRDPRLMLPLSKCTHDRLILDLHQALYLADSLDRLRHLNFTLANYLSSLGLPSKEDSNGLQTIRMLDISMEWLLRVHRWAYYNNASFEHDGDLILARNERHVRVMNAKQTDELKALVVKYSDYEIDKSMFDQNFKEMMNSFGTISEKETQWRELETKALSKLGENLESEVRVYKQVEHTNNDDDDDDDEKVQIVFQCGFCNKLFETEMFLTKHMNRNHESIIQDRIREETLRRTRDVIFEAFSNVANEKNAIMSLESVRPPVTYRQDRRGERRGGAVKISHASYFQRQRNGALQFKDPDAVSSTSPLLQLSRSSHHHHQQQQQHQTKNTNERKIDFDDF